MQYEFDISIQVGPKIVPGWYPSLPDADVVELKLYQNDMWVL